MRSRIRSLFTLRLSFLYIIEAALIGTFFIQSLRFLVGTLYARVASASLYPALNPALIDPNLPGLVEPATITGELTFLGYMLALPLLTLFIGRFHWLLVITAGITAVGRYLLVGDEGVSSVAAAALVMGGGLSYTAVLIRHRAQALPYMFILGFAADQLFRASGNTLDPSLSSNYAPTQLLLSLITVLLALFTVIQQEREQRRNREQDSISPDNGLLTFWGGIGLGAILFLELSLLAMPNAVAGRAGTSYIFLVPLLMGATLLPLVPWIRAQARSFIGLFDSGVRGWAWMLFIMLLLVFGTRFQGIFAGICLVIAQFSLSMLWWWLIRPQAHKERNFTGLWIIIGIIIFSVLVAFDIFTYEYAFVRDFAAELAFLNNIIPPVLRGLRGLGWAVLLLGVFLAVIPMAQTRRRIAWVGGTVGQSLVAVLLLIWFSAAAAYTARPPIVSGVTESQTIRIASYNIHAGYNEFFHYDLEALALTIQQSGANIVLLQEVEAGRMTSFGVDQPLWLGRRLGMDRRFYPTNEGLQGLAVLSNIEIVFDDGNLLTSVGSQTGLQRVQVRPDAGVITIYNTWLEPLLATGSNDTVEIQEAGQQTQLSQIFGIIRSHHPPDGQLGRTIIGGTFNNVPDSDLIRQMLSSGFVDYFADDLLERSATFVRTGVRARLDYIWTRNLQVIRRGVSESRASDHRLVTLEVQLR